MTTRAQWGVSVAPSPASSLLYRESGRESAQLIREPVQTLAQATRIHKSGALASNHSLASELVGDNWFTIF